MKWQKRLQADAGLTRTALAEELGISPTRLTHILKLLNLAPAIKRFVLAMETSIMRSPITESRLRRIARLENPAHQLSEFARLRQS